VIASLQTALSLTLTPDSAQGAVFTNVIAADEYTRVGADSTSPDMNNQPTGSLQFWDDSPTGDISDINASPVLLCTLSLGLFSGTGQPATTDPAEPCNCWTCNVTGVHNIRLVRGEYTRDKAQMQHCQANSWTWNVWLLLPLHWLAVARSCRNIPAIASSPR
jgi:hypothetical protein